MLEQQGCVAVWSAAIQHQYHCSWTCQQLDDMAYQMPPKCSSNSPICLLHDNARTDIAISPNRSYLNWAAKSSSIHSGPHPPPPIIICSCPWDTLCNTRPSATKMTWFSTRRISKPSSQERFIVMVFKFFQKMEKSDKFCEWLFWLKMASEPSKMEYWIGYSWNRKILPITECKKLVSKKSECKEKEKRKRYCMS